MPRSGQEGGALAFARRDQNLPPNCCWVERGPGDVEEPRGGSEVREGVTPAAGWKRSRAWGLSPPWSSGVCAKGQGGLGSV